MTQHASFFLCLGSPAVYYDILCSPSFNVKLPQMCCFTPGSAE